MKIQDLMDKITDLNISYWDMPRFKLVIKNSNDEEIDIRKFKIDKDTETIYINLK